MRTAHSLFRLVSILLDLAQDALQFLLLGTRSGGKVRAARRIEIKKEGSVTGDLTTPQILIEDGAYFKGSIEIAKGAEKDAHGNAFPPAA